MRPLQRRVPPRGFSLLEVLMALLVLGLMIQGGWGLLATFRGAAERSQETAEVLETARTVAWILDQELSGKGPEGVWFGKGTDSLSLRATRGLALVMDRLGPGEFRVCHRGLRMPNPAKDSVLVLNDSGGWLALDLMGSDPGPEGCWDGIRGREERWRVEERAGVGSWYLAQVFEVGSYHLADGAFRYRGGGGGRQPLTVENLVAGEFGPPGPGGEGVEWSLRLETAGPASHWRGRIR